MALSPKESLAEGSKCLLLEFPSPGRKQQEKSASQGAEVNALSLATAHTALIQKAAWASSKTNSGSNAAGDDPKGCLAAQCQSLSLFFERQKNRQREILGSFPRCSLQPKLGQANTRSQELHPAHPHGWQEAKHWNHPLQYSPWGLSTARVKVAKIQRSFFPKS